MELHPNVRAEVEERFSATDAGIVISELKRHPTGEISTGEIGDRSEDAWQSHGRARVQLAMVKYASGDIARLRVALAEQDFRDVLRMGGLEEDDWPEVLRRAGFRVPPRPPGPPPVPKPSHRPWPWRLWLWRVRGLLFALIVVAVLIRLAVPLMCASASGPDP